MLIKFFYFYCFSSERPAYLAILIDKHPMQVVVPKPADQQGNHYFTYDENIIEDMVKRLLYPRDALDGFSQ